MVEMGLDRWLRQDPLPPQVGLWADRSALTATGLPAAEAMRARGVVVVDFDPLAPSDITTVIVDRFNAGLTAENEIGAWRALLEWAEDTGATLVVLDRPGALDGTTIDGWAVGPHVAGPPFSRHGLTLGELATFLIWQARASVRLTVVPATGWSRDCWGDEVGVPWTHPRYGTPEQALVESALCVLDGTNLTVRRLADGAVFVGAPWLQAEAFALLCQQGAQDANIDDIGWTAWTDEDGTAGAVVHFGDRYRLSPYLVVLVLLEATQRHARNKLQWLVSDVSPFRPIVDVCTGTSDVRGALETCVRPRELFLAWEAERQAFMQIRSEVLRIPGGPGSAFGSALQMESGPEW